MSFIFGDADVRDPVKAGGKAASLARLASVAPVPPFFVVRPSAFADDGMRDEAVAEVSLHLARLGGGPFAVRSSGVGEDSAGQAHAGQFLSVLGVATESVPDAAHRVWRSAQADHVAAYRAAGGGAVGPVAMCVMIQRQLSPSAAGAAFSADPVTGRRDRVSIAAVAGLADALMNGEVDGDDFSLSRDGETLAIRVTGSAPVLDDAARRRVAALAIACEAACGCPQDVEWAVEDAKLYLLQSRPITTLGQLPADDDAVTIWDNSNIVESYPGLVSPLTFSFARYTYANVYRAFLDLLGVPKAQVAAHQAVLDNLLGRIEGRVYYNLLNWYRTLALLPGFAANRRAMEEMMGVGAALPPAVANRLSPLQPHRLFRVAAQAKLGLVGARLVLEALLLPRRIRRFEARLAVALAPADTPLGKLPLMALAAEYRRIEAALLARWDAPLVNDLVCMIAFSASRRVLGAWAGPAGIALHSEVMVGQGDMISAEPARLIREMGARAAGRPDVIGRLVDGRAPDDPALDGSIAAYLARFGDRCAEELKLESTPLHEDPSPLFRAIASSALSPPRQATVRNDADVMTLFPGRPIRGLVARALTRWAKARVRDRENLRLERTRVFGRVRALLRAMSAQLVAHGVLAQVDDVVQLTVHELLGAIEGGAVSYDLRGLVALRRDEWERLKLISDPPERIEHRGAAAAGLRDVVAAAPLARGTESMRTGLGCAPGQVRGVARVVRDARTASVAYGEILVARHTDPGWIALFTNAAAIVVERGSLLSHSAIVARELGIPCVVQLKGATDWIADGDTIDVDGASGRVTRL